MINPNNSVYIAILNQGHVRVDLANNLFTAITNSRIRTKVVWPSAQTVDNNRNQIVRRFLDTDFSHLLMIDDDTVPPPNILELLNYDKDIIAAPVTQWHENDMYWVIMDWVAEEQAFRQVPPDRRNGLQKVDGVGTGCILIKRGVLESVQKPFERLWDQYGIQALGQDFYFCRKATELGFEVWAHWDYPCLHYKSIDLIKVWELVDKYVQENTPKK